MHNAIYASLLDEEDLGQPKSVGTLQLFNRKNGMITQDDLARISFLRKLIGSTLIRCEYCYITLQTVIGLNMHKPAIDVAKDEIDVAVMCKIEGST